MAQATTSVEQDLIAAVDAAFTNSEDARGQAQAIADAMREAFKRGWPENSPKMGKDHGTYLMHKNEKLGHPGGGYHIYAYRNPPSPESPQSPHDHGACFVVYGVAKGGNTQTRWAWKYSDDATQPPALVQTQTIEQGPGEASYFLPGEIHSTQGSRTEDTVYVRITSQDLEQVWRHRYVPQHNTSRAFKASASPQRTA
jgi:hypothetical protein